MTAPALTLASTLPLPNSTLTIPRLGFGVYQSPASIAVKSCLAAFKAGYRHIDTAQWYFNEAQVGEAVATSGLPRRDLFITSKLKDSGASEAKMYESVVASCRAVGGPEGYADLFLVHTAGGGAAGRKKKWLALERAYKEGHARAIGVSNWNDEHMEEMREYATVWPPHVNQIELHPRCQQPRTVEYCHKHGIVVQAYCPLVRGQMMDDRTLRAVAKRVDRGPDRVLLRYCLQKDWVPLPKSDTPSRIEGNTQLYDFELSPEDMKALDGLDRGAKGALVIFVD